MATRRERLSDAFAKIVEKLNLLKAIKSEVLNDLGDVDTTGVIPEPGWILKYNGTNYVPCFRKVIRSSNLKIVQTGNNDYQTKFSVDLNIQRTGDYSFDLKTGGSMNTTTTDLQGRITLDGVTLATITNGQMFIVEFKDSAANDGDGRGTNQKGNLGNRLFANISTIGTHTLVFEFTGSTTNDSAAIFDCSCIVEEEFQIIDDNQ